MKKSSSLAPRAVTHHQVGPSHVTFESGAKRSKVIKGRFDLVPTHALRRVAERYALGASLYGEWNWQKGFPLSDLFNHIQEHLMAYRDRWQKAKEEHPEATDEEVCILIAATTNDDDLAGAAWGILTLMELEKRGRLS